MGKPKISSKPKDTGLPPAIRPSKEATDKFWEGVFQKRSETMPSALPQRINHQPAEVPTKQFPKYLMKINGQRRFLSFAEAVVAYASGMADVSFGRYVMQEDFSVEKMTRADKAMISEAADKYEAGK